MKRGIEQIFLDLSEGELIEADSLQEAIEQHPEVETVILVWSWEMDFYTSNAGPFEGYVSQNMIDEEYSFMGDREDALKFADDYKCWDGCDFVLLKVSHGYVLYGHNAELDLQTSWSDGYDHSGGISEGIDPSWIPWIRVDFDYNKGVEYLLSPDPIPDNFIRGRD